MEYNETGTNLDLRPPTRSEDREFGLSVMKSIFMLFFMLVAITMVWYFLFGGDVSLRQAAVSILSKTPINRF